MTIRLPVRWIVGTLVWAVPFRSAGAQLIRGVVTERTSGLPLTGVLVSIASVPDSLTPGGIRHTLTNQRGEYALRLSSGGSYIVSAKRIGVARHTTDILRFQIGETRRLDLVLERFEHRLPVVTVVDVNMCFRKADQRQQIMSLWDEVRTALLATGVSRQERLLTGWLSSYQRTLEPKTLRILDDNRSVVEGFFERPMRSISGDSLRKVGYWYKEDEATMVFHGPDEDVLLSTAFRTGHCFELITGKDAIKGFVGLAFEPRRPSTKGGIEGTLWIDAGNFELRFVDFRYDIITIPSNPNIGGQVHYVRHPSGAWLVRRWFIRMPQFPGLVSQVPTVWRLIEHGAGLYTSGLRSWETPGTITGIVMDSTGRNPLREAVVALSGTPFSTQVDSLGRFRFDSIAPGAYTLLASHSAYADFGQLADEEPLTLEEGKEHRASMRAINTTQLRSVVCDQPRAVSPIVSRPDAPSEDMATIRILMAHADGSGPLGRLRVWLRWRDPRQKQVDLSPITPGFVPRNVLGVESLTDAMGGVTFCNLPPKTVLEFVMIRPTGGDKLVASFSLEKGAVALRSFQVYPPQ